MVHRNLALNVRDDEIHFGLNKRHLGLHKTISVMSLSVCEGAHTCAFNISKQLNDLKNMHRCYDD
jgi:hypothetical protein